MPEQIDLGNGHTAEIRTALTGGDEKWFYIERGKLQRANGTGKPAHSGPDPENPHLMKDVPAEPAYLTEEDNFALFDMLANRLLLSCTLPGVLPLSAEVRDGLDFDVIHAIDEAVGAQMRRLQGFGPKPQRTGSTSAATSPDGATAPPATLTPEPSGTAPA